jgi:hypothetical protein
MVRSRLRWVSALVVALIAAALTGATGVPPANAAQRTAARPGTSRDSGTAVRHDTSRPFRDIGRTARRPPRHEGDEAEREQVPHPPRSPLPDPVVQGPGGSRVTAAGPVTAASFDGVGGGLTGPQGTFTVRTVPSDTDIAVSRTQIMEIVNIGLAVFDKSGRVLFGPVDTNSLWRGFGGACESTNDGDGIVSYDRAADRWIVAQFANVSSRTGPFFECLAISTTNDATGSYHRYAFQYAVFPDYPKLGVWPDAYYMTYNLFQGNATFVGSEVCAMDRSRMLAGQSAAQQCFTTDPDHGGLLASDLDGAQPPPTGAPNLVMGMATSNTALNYYRFHVDWANPAATTFTGPGTLTVANFSPACGPEAVCVPQRDTTMTLDTLSDRLMNRLVYRNFGDHESLVVTHTVEVPNSAGVRWYELRLADGIPTVRQQSTYAPDSTYRFLSSAAMNRHGDIGLGYSTSSATEHPGIRYTGRLADDPLGQLTQTETTLVAGNGSQARFSRWGDYANVSIDPADDCTFWFATEYIPSNGSFNWHTRIGAFRLPGCGVADDDFTLSLDPPKRTVNAGSSTTTTVNTSVFAGAPQQVRLSVTGLPPGTTATLNPTTVTAGGSSTLTLTTATATPVGFSTIQVVGTGTAATHAAPLPLIVEPGPAGGVRNGTFEADTLDGWTTTGEASISGSDAHGGAQAVLLGARTPTGDSTAAQTFTVPPGMTRLSFWYDMACPDIVQVDWITATLKDRTTGATTTVLPNTCAVDLAWHQAGAKVVAGHRYTLTLVNHDDHATGDASYTRFDDVALS